MVEVARARDWLGELEAVIAADEWEAFQALAKEAVSARPDLEDKVFAMASEYAAIPRKQKGTAFFHLRCYLRMCRNLQHNQSMSRNLKDGFSFLP
jgi:hypothetical protein